MGLYTFKYSEKSKAALIYKNHESLHRAIVFDCLRENPRFQFDRDRLYSSEDLFCLLKEFRDWREVQLWKRVLPKAN